MVRGIKHYDAKKGVLIMHHYINLLKLRPLDCVSL